MVAARFLAAPLTTMLALLAGAVPPIQDEPLVPANLRTGLRAVTDDLARAGERELVGRMRAVLASLGDDAKSLERFGRTWEKDLAAARASRKPREAIAKDLRGEIKRLALLLPKLEGSRKSELARAILALDCQQPVANQIVGYVQGASGEWLMPEELEWSRGAARTEALVAAARQLVVEITSAPSDRAQIGRAGTMASAHGVRLHGAFEPQKLERILREALRAAALANALLTGVLEIPKQLKKPHQFVLLHSDELYRPALDEALANHGITAEEHRLQIEKELRSFLDSRGWRTSRWRPEADFEALVLWDILEDWLALESRSGVLQALDAVDVSRRFMPEAPNPVPGEEMEHLGYPITVQLFLRAQEAELRLTLELSEGTSIEGKEVDGFFLSPQAPRFPDLVPPNAWCFIPREPLAKRTRYTAAARWENDTKVWSFTTGD